MNRLFKGLLSVFILYHLATAIVLANSNSMAARRWGNFFAPYANLFGLNTTWNFFAPDPAQAMYFTYRISYKDKDKSDITGAIPPQKDALVLNSSERRFIYVMRFFIINPERLKTILGPYLCNQYPGSETVWMKHWLKKTPSFDSVVASKNQDLDDLFKTESIMSYTHNCASTPDEVAP